MLIGLFNLDEVRYFVHSKYPRTIILLTLDYLYCLFVLVFPLFTFIAVEGLAVDVLNRKLFWTDTGLETDSGQILLPNSIGKVNLDGTEKEIILSEDHDELRAIVVDFNGG